MTTKSHWSLRAMHLHANSLREKCRNKEFFWSVFSRVWTEYRDKTERNYSQIEKNGLASILGIKKFHRYSYRRSFQIITNHNPLLGLLHEHKSILSMAAFRIQRWNIILLAYNYELIFKSGRKHGNTDTMSRLPFQSDDCKESSVL